MKMADRLILFITSFFLMIITLFIALVGIGLFDQLLVNQTVSQYLNNSDVKTSILIISLILFLMSLYIIAKSVQRKEVSPISKRSEIGDIKISMETLENLVTKTTSRIKGVRELKARVKPDEQGTMSVMVKIVFDGETPIPQITKEIQDTVKEKLELITGLSVGQVHVVVSNISQSTGKKVLVE
ncbi:alkaline shock response membrane anchor protein AmaP [Tepidibacillus marianensis]|uniref:alkaline shock response membrane anchor protein AmaP n=1 Tax=Tepidibacillus marianensis TaxID=3131995 RepID=UPI0030D5D901